MEQDRGSHESNREETPLGATFGKVNMQRVRKRARRVVVNIGKVWGPEAG